MATSLYHHTDGRRRGGGRSFKVKAVGKALQELWLTYIDSKTFRPGTAHGMVRAKCFPRSLSAPTMSTVDKTPSLDLGRDLTKSGSDTPVSLVCSFEIEKIDPRLLTDADPPFVEPRMCDIFEFVDLTGTDEEPTPQGVWRNDGLRLLLYPKISVRYLISGFPSND